MPIIQCNFDKLHIIPFLTITALGIIYYFPDDQTSVGFFFKDSILGLVLGFPSHLCVIVRIVVENFKCHNLYHGDFRSHAERGTNIK